MDDDSPDGMIENRTFDEVAIGESASLSRTVTQGDIDLFAVASGEVNLAHYTSADGGPAAFPRVIADGLLGAGLISSLVAAKLPGPGAAFLAHDLAFLKSVSIGDRITATVTVREKRAATTELVLECRCVNQSGVPVITGTARVRAPLRKIRLPRLEAPEIRLSRHERFRALLTEAAGQPPLATAIAHPCDADALGAAVEAARAGLITPILVGPRPRILKVAKDAELDISMFRLVDAPHS